MGYNQGDIMQLRLLGIYKNFVCYAHMPYNKIKVIMQKEPFSKKSNISEIIIRQKDLIPVVKDIYNTKGKIVINEISQKDSTWKEKRNLLKKVENWREI